MRASVVLACVLALTVPALAGCVKVVDPLAGASHGAPAFVADCSVNAAPDLWPDPCTALASRNPSPSKSEIDLAVNPKDPLNVIVGAKDLDPKASDCVWSVLQVTKDGGKTWKTVYVGGDKENREPLLAPYKCVTDPIMVFDADGVAYYALQAYDAVGDAGAAAPAVPVAGGVGGGSTFVLARSRDGGETWENYNLQHIGDGGVVFHDYPRMLVSPTTGAVHTIWNGVGSGGVTPWVSSTRDGGETVDPPVTFFASDAPRGTAFDSGFAATKDGVIFVTVTKTTTTAFLMGGASETEDVFLFRSDDDARSFSEVGKMFTITPTPRQIEGHEFRTPSFVELAIDASDGPFSGRQYAFWPDYRTGDSDVLSSFSTDEGVTWSEPVPVHAVVKNDQFMMRPTVGADGTVHVLHYDRSFDADNLLLDAVHAWSKDGGVTWQSQRLTASSFDGDLGVHQNGFPFIGDYNGIAVASDGTVYAAWGDTRTGVAEIAFARLVPA